MIVHVMHAPLADANDVLYLPVAAHWPACFNPSYHGGGVVECLLGRRRALAVRHPVPSRLDAGRRRDDLAAPGALIHAILNDDPLTLHRL